MIRKDRSLALFELSLKHRDSGKYKPLKQRKDWKQKVIKLPYKGESL